MKVKYVKWHNNYDFNLGNCYEAIPYKPGWLLIENDEGNRQLYREECFEKMDSKESEV